MLEEEEKEKHESLALAVYSSSRVYTPILLKLPSFRLVFQPPPSKSVKLVSPSAVVDLTFYLRNLRRNLRCPSA